MSRWMLTVFDVPDRLGGLLSRLRFTPTQNNPAHWVRVFGASDADRGAAQFARAHLRLAGLQGRWQAVAKPKRHFPDPEARHRTFRGLTDFSVHTSSAGSWRRKRRSQK